MSRSQPVWARWTPRVAEQTPRIDSQQILDAGNPSRCGFVLPAVNSYLLTPAMCVCFFAACLLPAYCALSGGERRGTLRAP